MQYDTDTALLNKIALEKKQREDAIALELAQALKIAQEEALSSEMPLRAKKPLNALAVDDLPSSFAWLGNLPFGVSEKQFSQTFKNSKYFDYGGRMCSLDKVFVKCLQGVDSKCENILLSFDSSKGLKSFSATYLSWDEFAPFYSLIMRSFGNCKDTITNYRPKMNRLQVVVKCEVKGAIINVVLAEGANVKDEKYRDFTFQVEKL